MGYKEAAVANLSQRSLDGSGLGLLSLQERKLWLVVTTHWSIIHKHLYLDQRKALPCLRALFGEGFNCAMDLPCPCP